MKRIFILFAVITLICYAQESKLNETNSEVKELTEFHEVIYKLWYSAWPEKKYRYDEIINASNR